MLAKNKKKEISHSNQIDPSSPASLKSNKNFK
jgi:hypothetical protein